MGRYDHARGKMIIPIFAGIAEFERGLIRERTRSSKKEESVLADHESSHLSKKTWRGVLCSEGKAVRELAIAFKVHAATIYRLAYSASGMAN